MVDEREKRRRVLGQKMDEEGKEERMGREGNRREEYSVYNIIVIYNI
jgi:hypothetical protein